MNPSPAAPPRVCGDCAACCEGWLSGEVFGRTMYPGCPCHFLDKTCTIYAERPDFCREYTCVWRTDPALPEWMQPQRCGVLVTRRTLGELEYFDAIETGKPMDVRVLNWLVLWALNSQKNLHYRILGGSNKIGSEVFLKTDLTAPQPAAQPGSP